MEDAILIPQDEPEFRWASETPISKLEGRHLIVLLRLLKRHAEAKKKAFDELYTDLPEDWNPVRRHLESMSEIVLKRTWRAYTDIAFWMLEKEADARKLEWDIPFRGEELDRPALRRAIAGALKDAIASHGPVTAKTIASAVKRIMGQLRTYALGGKR